jgi:hypothetical protein
LVCEKKRQFFRRKLSKIAENCDDNIDDPWLAPWQRRRRQDSGRRQRVLLVVGEVVACNHVPVAMQLLRLRQLLWLRKLLRLWQRVVVMVNNNPLHIPADLE